MFCGNAQKQNNQNYQQQYQIANQDYQNYLSRLNSTTTVDPHNIYNNLYFISNEQNVIGTPIYIQPPVNKQTIFAGAQVVGGNYDHNMNGDFLKIDFTGFKNSSFTDTNGIKHKLAKVTVTYSNLIVDGYHLPSGEREGFFVYIKNSVDSNGNIVNPWNAIQSYYNYSFDQRFDFYDENGHKLDIPQGLAWLPINSLTRWNDPLNLRNASDDHIERVQAVNNAKIYQIPNGMATLHNGILYSDRNTKDTNPTTGGFGNGEINNNAYGGDGGAGIAMITNDATLRWTTPSYDPNGRTTGGGTGSWTYVEANTDLLVGRSKLWPVHKTLSVHYHNNSVRVFIGCPACWAGPAGSC